MTGVIEPRFREHFKSIKAAKIQEERKVAKTVNIFKRLIPPSPRD
jgi:hypothetical protein